eukprot:TRINITY_DN9127_c0_g1_i1.p1 TRINITY_DN9127_c0_g1~~TRINITY_DN9127_c0_g1_i1.p1  ORF type:complete len:312 (+),score=52.69 TRINITY_DN9127_c0_g1_i1:86-1021(+)
MEARFRVIIRGMQACEAGTDAAKHCYSLAQQINQLTPAQVTESIMLISQTLLLHRLLLDWLALDSDIEHQDDYIYAFLSLRTLARDDEHQIKAINMQIINELPLLIEVFKAHYATQPDNYTAPELSSLFSALANETDPDLILLHAPDIVEQLFPCALSDSVGSVTACLAIASLQGKEPAIAERLEPKASEFFAALTCAISGNQFKERKWGPGPISRALYPLGHHKSWRRMLQRHIPTLIRIMNAMPDSWPVTISGRDQYFLTAQRWACQLLALFEPEDRIQQALQAALDEDPPILLRMNILESLARYRETS